jgi:GNAT superfamily N-acetyltransferase
MNKRKTRELTFDKVPSDVKRIADESMGRNALKSLWSSVVDNSPDGHPKFYLLLRVVDGIPVGFALFHYAIISTRQFDYTIGVIDAVCVSAPYRSSGYGAMLTFNVLRRMSLHGVNRIELVLKASGVDDDELPAEPILGSERFLYDLGFKKIAYLKEYWREDSLNCSYDCPICHDRPDRCTGMLLAINEY